MYIIEKQSKMKDWLDKVVLKMILFLEVAEEIETNILNGKLLPGDKLPSVRSMAKRLEVSVGTIQNAFIYLKHKNLIMTKRTAGYFVTEDIEYIKKMREEKANQLTRDIVDFLYGLGMKDWETAALFEDFFSEKDVMCKKKNFGRGTNGKSKSITSE